MSDSHPSRAVTVGLGERSYPVRIGTNLINELGALCRSACPGTRAFIAHDRSLPQAIVQLARTSLESSGFSVSTSAVEADERHKSLADLESLLASIAAARLERADPVIALGGGLTGDIAGFAAAVYRRGVPVVQCPTTLLGMVDAAIGGKTAVNLRVGDSLLKNLVGAVHQPRFVLADVSTLASLPDRQFRSGLAECIKHGMMSADFGAPDLAEWMKRRMTAIAQRDPGLLCELVERNVAVKAAVVASDEHETAKDGGRLFLNLGHTFGHAIETLPGVSAPGTPAPLLHGEAVALGLIAASGCSLSAGWCSPELASAAVDAVRSAGLPTSCTGLPSDETVIERMMHDKKVAGGTLRIIAPVAPGRCRVVTNPPLSAVRAGIAAIRAR